MKEKKRKMEKETRKDNKGKNLITRRYFLEIIGTGAIGITAAGGVALTAQFLSPNVLREPAKKFRAGSVDSYSPESVTLNKEQKVYVVRAKEGYLYAASAVCTHLGCITNWKAEQGIIACPCHGSKFTKEGKVIEGPAPSPLPRFLMTLDEQGQIIVDKNQIVSDDVILKI